QYDGMADIMKKMAGLGIRDRMRAVQQLSQTAAANPMGRIGVKKQGTGKRLTPKERARLKKDREKELRRRKREEKEKKNQKP
ncbi:MAG: signal recognition particle protein, partial [Thermoguttaceae bacterium]